MTPRRGAARTVECTDGSRPIDRHHLVRVGLLWMTIVVLAGLTAVAAGALGTTSALGTADTSDAAGTLGDDSAPGTDEQGVANESVVEAHATIVGNGSTGESVAAGDVTGDGVTDVLVGEPFADASGENAGAAYLFFGPLASGEHLTADADVTILGDGATDWAGFAVTIADVTGDGHGDLLVGAPLRNRSTGAVYVIYGGAEFPETISLADADVVIEGVEAGSQAGRAIAAVDGDDGVDLLVGAPRANAAGEESGAAYRVTSLDEPGARSLADADLVLTGEAPGDLAGWSVTGADLTGDGTDELVVGARRNGAGADRAGAVYATDGGATGTRSLSDAALTVRGPADGSEAGFSIASAGDVTGDGRDELAIGAPFAERSGAVYLLAGADPLPSSISLSTVDPAFVGVGGADRAGWDVSTAGDLDCDGVPDVLVGAPHHDGESGAELSDAGAAYVAYGNASVEAVGTEYAHLADGEWAGAYAGYRVAYAGDVTGDGTGDLLLGAPDNDSSAAVGPDTRGGVAVLSGTCPVDTSPSTPTDDPTASDPEASPQRPDDPAGGDGDDRRSFLSPGDVRSVAFGGVAVAFALLVLAVGRRR